MPVDSSCRGGRATVVRSILRLVCVSLLMVVFGCQKSADNGKIVECELLGGEVVRQPKGSPITACCYENGCWICDEAGNDCKFDPVYSMPFWQEALKKAAKVT